MPSGKFHRLIEKKVFGKEINVGRVLDFPSVFSGSKHRKYMHDNKTIAIMMLKNKELGKAAALHIALDRIFYGPRRYIAEMIAKVMK